MKAYLAILLFFSVQFNLMAQKGGMPDAFEKGITTIDLYSGIGRYYGPRDYLSSRIPVFGSVAYGLTKQLSVGAYFGWHEITYKFAFSPPVGINYYNYGLKGEWHITNFLNERSIFNLPAQRCDVYLAAHIGQQTNDARNKTSSLLIGYTPVFVYGFHIGARYYTLQHVGFMAEFGFTPNAILNLGICGKF